ncbi:hypothetical protein CTheo_5704 [Ceratobasidium theobromae]|uniref:Uncharacterized protein n=1 Tax=Ceratobasidium theobromae TaxID=1582974 RepID=A0A5N5QHC3_9AGAM|nr:hypothetical protein CTheo_5704 [Ceratobasidium theobromae]
MNPTQTPTGTHNSLFTPKLATIVKNNSLNSRKLGCVLLTSFSKPNAETRYLVLLVLESTCRYFDDGESSLLDERQLRELTSFSDVVMALASRVNVDLRNAKWTGDVNKDVQMMYTQIIINLTSFLLDNSPCDSRLVVDALQSSLPSARTFVYATDVEELWAYVESAAERCAIWYPHGMRIIEQEEPKRYKKILSKLNSGLKCVRKTRGRGTAKRAEKEGEGAGGEGCGQSGASMDGGDGDSGASTSRLRLNIQNYGLGRLDSPLIVSGLGSGYGSGFELGLSSGSRSGDIWNLEEPTEIWFLTCGLMNYSCSKTDQSERDKGYAGAQKIARTLGPKSCT